MNADDAALEMTARAMIELFGDQAPKRARERAAEYPERDKSDGRRFWLSLSEKIELMLANQNN